MAARKSSVRQRAIAAALGLASKQEWSSVALRDIAQSADLTLAELYGELPSKQAVLAALSRDVDTKLLAEIGEAEADETPRDRLFDVIMRRIDALEPHKAAIESILRGTGRDPVALVCAIGSLQRSMAWMLEAAGIPASGLGGAVRVKGLTALYCMVLRAWLSDDTSDNAQTMAALDRGLRRAEWILDRLSRRRPRSPAQPAA